MPFLFSDLRRVSSFALILKIRPDGLLKSSFLSLCGPGPCSLCLILISGPLTGPRSLSRGISLWIVHAPHMGSRECLVSRPLIYIYRLPTFCPSGLFPTTTSAFSFLILIFIYTVEVYYLLTYLPHDSTCIQNPHQNQFSPFCSES